MIIWVWLNIERYQSQNLTDLIKFTQALEYMQFRFKSAHFPKHPVSISSDTLGSSILRMSVFLFPVKSRSVPNYTSYNQKIPTAQFSVGHMDSSEAAFDRVPKKA